MLNVITDIPGVKVVLIIMGIVAVLAVIVSVPYYFLIIKFINDEQKAEMETYEMEAYHRDDKHTVGEAGTPAN